MGHIRDIRRLVVAMSRARLGLYLFGNLPLFSNCLELQKPLHFFEQRPSMLRLVPQERAPTRRAVDAEVPAQLELEVPSLADFGRLLQQMIQRRAQGVDQRQFESHMEEDVEPVEERKVTDMDTD